MLGAVITFLVACGIIGTYIYIMHRFLKSSEETIPPEPTPQHEVHDTHLSTGRARQWARTLEA
jgi:hypothetical protein